MRAFTLYHAKDDSTKLSYHCTLGTPSPYSKPGYRKGATNNITINLKIYETASKCSRAFSEYETVRSQNSRNVQFLNFPNGGPMVAASMIMAQVSHSLLDDSNQFTSVHPNSLPCTLIHFRAP